MPVQDSQDLPSHGGVRVSVVAQVKMGDSLLPEAGLGSDVTLDALEQCPGGGVLVFVEKGLERLDRLR